MEELLQLKDNIGISAEQIDIPFILLNFFVCVIVSFTIRKFYINYSYSLTGKHHIGSILPILSSVIFLVIIVVKSSLALSLGLVGALSIVRFRTPIKEPEELVYLFLSIAIGLGYGAGYTLITTILTLLILFFIYFFLSKKESIKTSEYNLLIEKTDSDFKFDEILNKLKTYCDTIKIIRVDNDKKNHTVVFSITLNKSATIDGILNIFKDDTDTSLSFFEAKTNW